MKKHTDGEVVAHSGVKYIQRNYRFLKKSCLTIYSTTFKACFMQVEVTKSEPLPLVTKQPKYLCTDSHKALPICNGKLSENDGK